jgi:hypothetical protein
VKKSRVFLLGFLEYEVKNPGFFSSGFLEYEMEKI